MSMPALPESHRALQASLRAFCEERVKGQARDWDHAERLPVETVQALGELGVLGMQIPEDYGGAGLDTLAVAVAVEELARYDGSLALTVASHNGLGTSHLRLFGNRRTEDAAIYPASPPASTSARGP